MPASSLRKTVLAVAAHPDDEVLGCGATLARHVAAGDDVHVLIMGQGVFSRSDGSANAQALEALRACAREANRILGIHSLDLLEYPDNRMDGIERLDLAKAVEAAMERHNPEIVYTHFPGDLNIDHVCVSDAVTVACRPVPGSSVRSLRYFEVQSSTEWRPAHAGSAPFGPNLFVDVAATLEKKIDALRAYGTEMRAFPHARSIEAVEHLARWRGANVGVEAAEAFVLARSIEV